MINTIKKRCGWTHPSMKEFDRLMRLLEGVERNTRKQIFDMYIKSADMKTDNAFFLEHLLAFIEGKYGMGVRYKDLSDREKGKVVECLGNI